MSSAVRSRAEITPEFLREHNACDRQVTLFESWLEKRGWKYARLTPRNIRAASRWGLYVERLWWNGILPCADEWRDISIQLGVKYAYWYALFVDECPRDDTRSAVCSCPEHALAYAFYIDKAPRDNTREAVCSSPEHALRYALYVEKAPHDETRKAACRDAGCAIRYAEEVDKGPHDDTRRAACRDAGCALRYALRVDKIYRDDTWEAASRHDWYADRYHRVVRRRWSTVTNRR